MAKITIKWALFILTILSFPLSSFAFHKITEILPEGRLLVCKDYNQIVKGKNVETYKLNQTKNRGTILGIQTDEFLKPLPDSKVGLYHRDFHQNGRWQSKYHEQKIGTGTVVSYDFTGKEITTFTSLDKKRSLPFNDIKKISNEDVEQLSNDCVVINPDDQIQLEEVSSVEFEL